MKWMDVAEVMVVTDSLISPRRRDRVKSHIEL